MGSEQRPALGRHSCLGYLYDVRSDKLLDRSLLKTGDPPPGSTKDHDIPAVKYRYTRNDSLEEKWKNFDVSAEMGLSILCGLLDGQGCMAYLSRNEMSARVRQASVVCEIRTSCVSLFLGKELRDCLDLDALHTHEATHVIWSIDWGAQAVVTACESATDRDGSYGLEMQLGNGPQSTAPNSSDHDQAANTPAATQSVLRKVVESIGKTHLGGKVHSDGNLRTMATSFEFEIDTNMKVNDLPTEYEGVVDFIRSMPSRLKTMDGGKGVPITFHLRPITELARELGMQLRHDIIIRRLDHGCIDRCVQRLQEQRDIVRSLAEYAARVKDHSFCVPSSHLKKAHTLLRHAKSDEDYFNEKLRETIAAVRGGSQDMSSLHQLVGGDGADGHDDEEMEKYRSIVQEYVDKMDYADFICEKGAQYMAHCRDKVNCAIADSEAEDLYVLEFSRDTQRDCTWILARKMLKQLLEGRGGTSYSILVVDCDMGEAKQLAKAQITKYRGGKIVVADVVAHEQELEDKCLVKCDDESKVDRSRARPAPPSHRAVRIPCPGKHCFDSGRTKWTCPSCRSLVSYGFTDTYMYCRCSCYPAMHAVFKCKHQGHGSEYAKHNPDHLLGLLAALEPDEVYNLLIVGRTGTGKSMFINAFQNYLRFETLGDAMADQGRIRYVIPFSFTREEENGEVYEVVVGDETDDEKFSRTGESGTRQTMVYSFAIEDKIINLIDTPGIGDTRGPQQDRKNMDDILGILGRIDKLSAVLFLLPPDETRLDSSFEFCMASLLSHLHRDVIRNIFFVFNRASSTGYRPGATRIQLDQVLKGLNAGLARNNSNQFFFDSEGYMCLAAYKQKPPRHWADRDRYDQMWAKSATEAYRLLTTAMELPTHPVRKMLSLNRARQVLEGMAKTLTHFASAMETSQRHIDAANQHLANLDIERTTLADLAEKLKVTITVPVRYNLSKRRTVCAHSDCMKSRVPCHDGCDIIAPDELTRSPNIYWCSAFKRCWIPGYSCRKCGHGWEAHMLVSYELRDEPRTIYDQETKTKIRRNKDTKLVVSSMMEFLTRNRNAILEEQALVNTKRAEFGLYLATNALVGDNDPYSRHLDVCIEAAKLGNRAKESAKLAAQKAAYMVRQQELRDAVAAGSITVLEEDGLEKAIEDLKNMPIFGQHLSDALDPPITTPQGERFKHVPEEPEIKSRKPSWFRWPW